ncbi:unnamed protein product, partial [Larinioides sclopetarius]
MDVKNLKLIQINVNHCEPAHSGVLQVARDLSLDMVAVQDPHFIKGYPPIQKFGCKTFLSGNKKTITYIFNKDLRTYFKFNTKNVVQVEIHYVDFILN